MMTRRYWWTLALAACLTLAACEDDDSKTPIRNTNNTTPDMTPDMVIAPDMAADMTPDMTPDMDAPDQSVADMPTDGQVAGTWDVSPAAGGDVIVTLVLMHERDAVPVVGTYKMGGAAGAEGELANASYVNNQLSAQWTTAEGQHLINMGAISGADGAATYVSPTSGGIGAQVTFTRK